MSLAPSDMLFHYVFRHILLIRAFRAPCPPAADVSPRCRDVSPFDAIAVAIAVAATSRLPLFFITLAS